MYYKATADKEFFAENASLKQEFERVLSVMVTSRQKPEVYLYPSNYLSDGLAYGDWHTGTNVCAWNALEAMSLLCEKVYHETEKSSYYQSLADKTKQDIERYCVMDGEFGKQYNAGVFVDGRETVPMSDGEESDLTLIPFYGYARNDEITYQNFMKFAMTDKNIAYNPLLKCVKWGSDPYAYPDGIIATAPGYLKGIAAITTSEQLLQKEGFMGNLRRVIDADGAIWWWPYNKEEYETPQRGIIGKSCWASGVFAITFINRFLGLTFDANERKLTIAPLAIKEYSWNDARFGNSVFDISYSEKVTAIKNKNSDEIKVTLQLPLQHGHRTILINGKVTDQTNHLRYFDQPHVELTVRVGASESVTITQQ